MNKTFAQPLRRTTSLTTLMGLLVFLTLAFSLAACGGDTAAPASSGSSSTSSSSTSSSPASSSSGSTIAVSISEKTGDMDIYSFDPQTVSIKVGDSIKFTNNSDENHKLAVSPAGPTVGTVTKSGSNDNTFTMSFPSAGTYTITSTLVQRAPKDAAKEGADSKAMLTVTVK